MTKFDRIKNNLELLKVVSKCKKNLRCDIIKKGSKDFILSICELVDNLLRNNIKLSKSEYEKMYKYKPTLRKIVKKSPLKQKKRLISQKGGFLQFLIPAAITALGSIISDVIKSN